MNTYRKSVEKNNKRVQTQFKKLIEGYNKAFARLIFDKAGYAYIMNIEEVKRGYIEEENGKEYIAKVYKSAPKGELREALVLAEAELTEVTKEKVFDVGSIEVSDAWQNCGIGRAMLKKIECFAQARNMKKMSLFCLSRTLPHKETGKKFNVNFYIYSKEGYRLFDPTQNPDRTLVKMVKDIPKKKIEDTGRYEDYFGKNKLSKLKEESGKE